MIHKLRIELSWCPQVWREGHFRQLRLKRTASTERRNVEIQTIDCTAPLRRTNLVDTSFFPESLLKVTPVSELSRGALGQ